MKITKTLEHKTVLAKELREGDLFLLGDDVWFTCKWHYESGQSNYMVNLRNGELSGLSSNDVVVPLIGELIVKEQ